jgi:hypothetical protein
VAEDLAFTPLSRAQLQSWSAPGGFGFLDRDPVLPLADSEILHVAHYAPLAIHMTARGPVVGLLVHSALTTSNLVAPDGRWLPPYLPIALRCLPFRPQELGKEPCVALELITGTSERFQLFDQGQIPTKEFKPLAMLMDKLALGQQRIGDAAKVLMAADLLSPLIYPINAGRRPLMSVRTASLAMLKPSRAATLTADRNLPFELAAALIFSQRWMAKGVTIEVPDTAPDIVPQSAERRDVTPDWNDELPLLDDNELFSIEAFMSATKGTDEPA